MLILIKHLRCLYNISFFQNNHTPIVSFIGPDTVSIYVPLATRENGKCQRSVMLLRMETSRDNPCDVLLLRREEIEFQDLFVISRWTDKVYYLCAPQWSAVVYDKHFRRRVQSRLLPRYILHRIDLQLRELDFATKSVSFIRENRTRE